MQKYSTLPLSYDELTDFVHLYKSHKIARCNKRHKYDVIRFENDLFFNLCKLERELKLNKYKIGGYRTFFVYEPKKREIQALGYKDRIVQHTLCDNFLIPFYKHKLILCNCACQENKGTYFARQKLKSFLVEYLKKYGKNGYVLKCDIKKYFANINHNILKNMLNKDIKDKKIFNLMNIIIDSYNFDAKKGLPIGNQVSQLMGVVYMDKIDRLIKEKLQIKYYIRYMDDLVLMHHDKEYLKFCLKQVEEKLKELDLVLNNKTQIINICKGMEFLGGKYYILKSGKVIIKIKKQTVCKIKNSQKVLCKLKQKGLVNVEYLLSNIGGIKGHFKGYNANMIYIKYKKAVMT